MSEEKKMEYEFNPHTKLPVQDHNGNLVPKGCLWVICDDCNYATHICPGCGVHHNHWDNPVCDDCVKENERYERENGLRD